MPKSPKSLQSSKPPRQPHCESPHWQQGWYLLALPRPCPNFGTRPPGGDISLIVVHSISLPPGEYGGDAVLELFTNSLDFCAHPYYDRLRGLEVSSHFFLRRCGLVYQCVSCANRAWHAGASSWQGRENCNDFSIGIELEGLEGESFEDAQYKSLASLATAIARRYPIQSICGHQHISPGRKGDPGEQFCWDRLKNEVQPHLDRSLLWPEQDFMDDHNAFRE